MATLKILFIVILFIIFKLQQIIRSSIHCTKEDIYYIYLFIDTIVILFKKNIYNHKLKIKKLSLKTGRNCVKLCVQLNREKVSQISDVVRQTSALT